MGCTESWKISIFADEFFCILLFESHIAFDLVHNWNLEVYTVANTKALARKMRDLFCV